MYPTERTEDVEQANGSRSSSRPGVRDILAVSFVYVLSLLFVAGFPHPVAGFPLDDSWIHQVVARNLAQDGTLGFIPGVRSSGSSSLLWSLLLAAKWKFLPGMNPVIYSGLLSGFLFVVIGCGLLAMARKDGLSETSCWIWALTPALSGNFIWLGMLGMEHVLFVALSVAGVYLWFQTSLRSAVACSLCLGALSMTRPEGMVLTVLMVLAWKKTQRGRRDLAMVIGVVAVCVLVTFTANFVTSHSWLPTTYAGRKLLYFGTEKIPLLFRITFPYDLAKGILHPWIPLQQHILYPLKAIVVALEAIGLIGLFRGRRLRTSMLCLWSFVHIAIYAVMLPSGSHGGRYQPLYLALNFPLMFLGADAIFRRLTLYFDDLRTRKVLQATAMIAALSFGGYSLRMWREVTQDGIAVIESTHARMGKLLIDSLSREDKVAAFDIGRMGYIYGGDLIDLGGLTDSSFLPYLREHRLISYLEDRKISYFVWPVWPPNRDDYPLKPQILVLAPAITKSLVTIASFCSPIQEYKISFGATMMAAPCQTLYRLNDLR
jgi:hypothetical protein